MPAFGMGRAWKVSSCSQTARCGGHGVGHAVLWVSVVRQPQARVWEWCDCLTCCGVAVRVHVWCGAAVCACAQLCVRFQHTLSQVNEVIAPQLLGKVRCRRGQQ